MSSSLAALNGVSNKFLYRYLYYFTAPNYPFYHAALGELEISSGHVEDAREHFVVALKLARNPMERSFFEQRIGACK